MDFYEALSAIRSSVRELEKEWVFLDRALGRVCGATIHAPVSVPPCPLSRWDGFALKSKDTIHASVTEPVALKVIRNEIITAGSLKELEVASGNCVRIMTGGILPGGCDAVVKLEEVVEKGDRIFVRAPLIPGDGVLKTGGLVREGEIIVQKGMIISPYHLCSLAELGITALAVFRRPRVGFMAIGDELRMPGAASYNGMRYAGGQYFLGGLAKNVFRASVVNFGVVRDNPAEIAKAAIDSLEYVDLLVTTGGTGMGAKDYIETVWQNLGVETIFPDLNIKPGKSSKAGILKDRLWIALPGGLLGGVVIYTEILNEISRIWYDRPETMTPTVRVEISDKFRRDDSEFDKIYRGFLGRVELKKGKLMFHRETECPCQALNAYLLLSPGQKSPLTGEITEARLLVSEWE